MGNTQVGTVISLESSLTVGMAKRSILRLLVANARPKDFLVHRYPKVHEFPGLKSKNRIYGKIV